METDQHITLVIEQKDEDGKRITKIHLPDTKENKRVLKIFIDNKFHGDEHTKIKIHSDGLKPEKGDLFYKKKGAVFNDDEIIDIFNTDDPDKLFEFFDDFINSLK